MPRSHTPSIPTTLRIPPNLPHAVLDTDLLSRLLVILEPILHQLDARKLGPGLDARRLPLSLPCERLKSAPRSSAH